MPIESKEEVFDLVRDASEVIPQPKIAEVLTTKENVDPKVVEDAMLRAYGEKATALLDQGYPQEDIIDVLQGPKIQATPEFVTTLFETIQGPREAQPLGPGAPTPESTLTDPQQQQIQEQYTTEDLVAMTKQIYSDERRELQDLWAMVSPSYNDEELAAYKTKTTIAMQQTLNNIGLQTQVVEGKLQIDVDGTGEFQEVTPGIIEEVKANKFNTIMSIAGGIAGGALAIHPAGRLGMALFGRSILAKFTAWAGGNLVGGTVGGIALGSTGAALDAAYNAAQLQEELEVADYWRKMKSAGAAEAIMGILGTTIIDSGVQTAKVLGRSYDLVLNGNARGAYQHLKDVMGIDDAQAEKIVKEYERIAGKEVPGMTLGTKARQVIPITQPGGEAIVGAAAKIDTKAGAALLRDISSRSRQLSEEVGKISHSINAPIVIGDLLDAYDTSVKAFYGYIKGVAKEASETSAYQFDYDKLAVEPLLKKVESRITNPAVQNTFELYTQRVRKLGGLEVVITPGKASKTISRPFARGGPVIQEIPGVTPVVKETNKLRSFSDLLDLRRTINDFKYNKRIKSVLDYEAVNTVLAKIDAEINRSARVVMANGEEWLQGWKEANVSYAKMKKLEKNALAKAFRTKGATPKQIVRKMADKITAIDGTFMEVIHALPADKRHLAEGAVLDVLVNKFTTGTTDGFSAVHFPKLAEELKYMSFTTPEAKALKRTITEMAKVFKNDVNLYQVAGNIEVPKFQSYLTTDPVIRAKYEVASTVFNKIKQYIPGEEGKKIALVRQVAKFLESPQNAQSIEALKKSLPNDPELDVAVRQLMTIPPGRLEMGTYPKVKVFKVYAPGAKAGQVNRYTDEKVAKEVAKRTGAKVQEELVNPQLIATEQEIMKAAGWEEWQETTLQDLYKNKELVRRLKAQGYSGIALRDKPGPKYRPDTLIFK